MSNALTTYNGAEPVTLTAAHNPMAFEPGSIGEAMQLAAILFKSGLMPEGFKSPEAVVTAIIYGRELGLTAMQSIRGIHVIKGRPTMSADMMVALVKRSPICEFFRLVSTDATKATYETKRRDEPAPVQMSYTIEEARTANALGKDTWKAHPAAMLRARCASSLARAVYQDLVMGVYDPDELEQAPATQPAKYVQPEPVPAAAVIEGEVVNPATAALADPSEPTDALRQAQKGFFSELGKAAKKLGLSKEETQACAKDYLRRTYGSESTNDRTPDEVKDVTAKLKADPSIIIPELPAAEPPIPDSFDPEAPFSDGHTGSQASLEAEG